MTIPNIQINSTHVNSIGIYSADIPEWLTTTPNQTVPNVPPATVIIGNPIIDIPGCVETHEFSDRNNEIIKDDPDNLLVFCDAEYPSYDAMDYEPDQLQMQLEAAPPPVVQPPPEVDPPEVPPTGDLATDVACPGVGQLRIGDVTQSGDEKVIGHELSQDGKTCITLYEPTSPMEKYVPPLNQVTSVTALAVVATAGAAATPLLLRIIKPVIKKLTTTVQKKLGKHREISKSEMTANRYRQSKGLPPLKIPKKKKR